MRNTAVHGELGAKDKNYMTENRIICNGFVVVQDAIYFSAFNSNGLYKWSKNKAAPQFISYFPDENLTQNHLHAATYLLGDKIYFAPAAAKNIAIYDLKDKSIKNINVEDYAMGTSKYYNMCSYKNKLYMIPSRAEYIIEVDTYTDSIVFHNEWVTKVNIALNQDMPAMKYGAFIRKEKLYIPYLRDNCIFEIELKNFIVNTIKIGDFANGFIDAYYDKIGDRVWLLQSGVCSVICYSFASGKAKKFEVKKNNAGFSYPYIKMIQLRDELVLIPYQDSVFMSLNMKTKEIKTLHYLDNNKPKNSWGYYYSGVKISEDYFIALSTGDLMWDIYDFKGNLVNEIECTDEKMCMRNALVTNRIVHENLNSNLKQFLQCIGEVGK